MPGHKRDVAMLNLKTWIVDRRRSLHQLALLLLMAALVAGCKSKESSNEGSQEEPSEGEADEEGPGTTTTTGEGGSAAGEASVGNPGEPAKRDAVKMTALSAGRSHTCGIGVDGRVYCWGGNRFRQLGTRQVGERCQGDDFEGDCATTPVAVPRVGANTLASGALHTCAGSDNELICWGAGPVGFEPADACATVRGPVGCTVAPGKTGVGGAGALAAGTLHTCATRDGKLFCWGANPRGQLADLDSEESVKPTELEAPGPIRELAAGDLHTCAVLDDGSVACIGANQSGQLGNGTRKDSSSWVTVEGLEEIEGLACGAEHTCAWNDGGTLWCWGSNMRGQIGDNSFVDRLRPVKLESVKASLLAAGKSFTCAAETKGVRCWGANRHGQLGDGTLDDRGGPVKVSDLEEVTAIAAGEEHVCAVTRTGETVCWGANDAGQLARRSHGEDGSGPAPVVW